MSTAAYNFSNERGAWVTPQGDPICAVIFEPRDFDNPQSEDEADRLEYFLDWEDGDLELPTGDERRQFIGDALIEAERALPDMVYELVRDTIRDTINDMLRERAEKAAAIAKAEGRTA